MSSLKSDHHFLCEFLIFFSRVNLTLRYKFSQFIHRFKMWILKWWPWAVDSTYTIFLNSLGCTSKFLPIHQRFWKLGFLKSPCLHIWSSDNEDGLSVWHMVQEGRTPFMSMLCFAWIFPNMQCYFPNHLSKFRYFLPLLEGLDLQASFDFQQHKYLYLIPKESMSSSIFEAWNKNIFSFVAKMFFPPYLN